jgi:hypothetical protein
MPRYGPVWLEIAREHYASLPADAREQVDARLEELLENPRQPPSSAYDERTDQWTTVYGEGAGPDRLRGRPRPGTNHHPAPRVAGSHTKQGRSAR